MKKQAGSNPFMTTPKRGFNRFIRSISLFILVVLSFSYINAQHTSTDRKIVNGVIVDGATGEPVIGVSIVAKNDKTIGTTSDHLGNFQLSLPPEIDALQVSLLGYQTQIVKLTGRLPLEIALTEDSRWLSDVVVVGYSSQKKETLTGSIAVINSGGLVQSPVANISNALIGRAPGIMSTQASGEAGDNAATIRIRGVSTLNSGGHEPLIVIDGIQSSISVMNALDANEIENISILKDASSTAVYGVKGANGVVIVTTKRGKSGAPKINMSYRYGVATLVSKLKMLGSYDYALFRNEAIQNDGNPSNYQYLFTEDELWKFQNNRDYTPTEVYSMNLTSEQEAALLNAPALYYGSHDYFEEQFGEVSPQQQYNLNISGGSDRMQYFASIGYFSEGGVFKNADYGGADANSAYDRYNIRSNLDIGVFKNLKVSIDFGGQFETKKGILGNAQDGDVTSFYSRHKSMLVSILAGPPYAGPGIVDGKLVTAYAAYQNPLQGKGGGGYSPIASILTKETMQSRNTNLNSTIRLKHEMDYLTKGLSVSGTISYSDLYMKGIEIHKYVPTYTAVRNPQNPVEILFFGGATYPQTVTDNYRNNKWNRFYMEGKVDYERNFDKHSVTGLLLYNAQKTSYPGYLYNVPAGLIGIAGRFTYRYDDRYLFEFNMGYNGSENFPEGKRFGFFPAYSLGWVATNEKFIPKNKWLTWLKIRASYGEVGNDQIGGRRFLYLPSTWGYSDSSLGNSYFFGNTNGSSLDPLYNGSYESTLGNPNVTWERAKKTNIGLDFNLFSDQLSFIGDVFMENRDNILWNLGTVPSIVAATLPPDNIGKVSNKGYEIQIKWTSRIGAFEYSIGGNISYAVNKIEYMDEPQYPYEWMNTTGFSIGQYKGFKTAGFYNSQEEANNRPYVSLDGNKVQAGDIRYVDIDGDGIIDANDKVPIGYSNLPRYSFGANVDLAYKGFYISALFTGSHQGSMPMTSFYILNPFYMTSGNALQFQYDGRWTPEKVEQGIEPTFPRASIRTYDSQNGELNELWLRSSQFIRLKNVEFGYNFTNLGILKKYGLSGLRIFVSGSNLYTWGSKLIDGYDPEQEDTGGTSDGYLYPPIRTYNLGVAIQF